MSEIKLPIIGAIYKHYKSAGELNHTYRIIGIAKHSETEELMVVYEPIVRSTWMLNTPANFAVRPLEMFTGQLEVDGKLVQRFEMISNPKGAKL
jgi:hypothetical protein